MTLLAQFGPGARVRPLRYKRTFRVCLDQDLQRQPDGVMLMWVKSSGESSGRHAEFMQQRIKAGLEATHQLLMTDYRLSTSGSTKRLTPPLNQWPCIDLLIYSFAVAGFLCHSSGKF